MPCRQCTVCSPCLTCHYKLPAVGSCSTKGSFITSGARSVRRSRFQSLNEARQRYRRDNGIILDKLHHMLAASYSTSPFEIGSKLCLVAESWRVPYSSSTTESRYWFRVLHPKTPAYSNDKDKHQQLNRPPDIEGSRLWHHQLHNPSLLHDVCHSARSPSEGACSKYTSYTARLCGKSSSVRSPLLIERLGLTASTGIG
jgi:hypothetical protein